MAEVPLVNILSISHLSKADWSAADTRRAGLKASAAPTTALRNSTSAPSTTKPRCSVPGPAGDSQAQGWSHLVATGSHRTCSTAGCTGITECFGTG